MLGEDDAAASGDATTAAMDTAGDAQQQPAKAHRSTHHSDMDDGEFPHLLRVYYGRLFPHSKFYNWLSYKHSQQGTYFFRREFSFTLKDDVYIRYLSFRTQQEMTDEIKKVCPYKIDIGAVFTATPKDHKKLKASEFYPMEKELVFDIDMTDYDELRTCCSGAAICAKCWPFMTIAIKTVDQALREDFGFVNLLWVYSGRRGVHCWVCDTRARKLSQDARTAVAEYLNVVKGGDSMARKVSASLPLHPALERAYGIAEPYFYDVILATDGQDVLGTVDGQRQMLAIIGDDELAEELLDRWEDNPKWTSRQRWDDLVKHLTKSKKQRMNLSSRKYEIVLQYTYPRLDINVSKQLNHLLKSPFVVHPKTGRVCVPINVEEADEFSPFDVPTIGQLCREIDDFAAKRKAEEGDQEDGARKSKEVHTSLDPYLEVFGRFLKGLRSDVDQARADQRARVEELGDW
eukprot:m.486827 g.486827  ORF g.486827 m.486827 type:complete len:460 (+) comp24630_c0_seq1:346-1725(+)